MKKLFLLLTLTLISLSITLFGMEMEPTNSATQHEMVTIEIDQQKFETQRKYAELSATIKHLIEDAQELTTVPDDSTTVPLNITPEQWQLIAPLLENVYQITLAPDEQEKKEREQTLYAILNDKTDDELSAIINGADKLAIEPLLDVGLEVARDKMIASTKDFVQSENPENYNPFNLPDTLTSGIVPQIVEDAAKFLFLQNITNTEIAKHIGMARSVAFSPDGNILASTVDKIIQLWDISDRNNVTEITTLTGHTNWVESVAFSPDGNILASASRNNNDIKLWDLSDKSNITEITTPIITGRNFVAFSPDGKILATTKNKKIKLWNISDIHNITEITTLTGHTKSVESVAFSPDGKILASASQDKNDIKLWDISDKSNVTEITTPIITGRNFVAFSPDGKILATTKNKKIKLWNISDIHNITEIATVTGHTKRVTSIAFSPDSNTLASASLDDHNIKLWNISDKSNITEIKTLTCWWILSIIFSPDGKSLASAGLRVDLWNIPKEQSENLKKQCSLQQALFLNHVYKQEGITICSHENKNISNLYNSFDLETKTFIKPLVTNKCELCKKRAQYVNYFGAATTVVAAVGFILWKAWKGN